MSSLVSLSRHTLKQLKFVLPGAALSYYFDSHNRLLRLLAPDPGSDSWAPCVLFLLPFRFPISAVPAARQAQ